MILHIPHSSRTIPEELRDPFALSDADLSAELTLMTDAFTDELFSLPSSTAVRFPISRLVVDVERFADDADEPMSKVGMGMIYTRTAHGKELRRSRQSHEQVLLRTRYYEPHHQRLLKEVQRELEKDGRALIVDCHSFPSRPLPCDEDQGTPRPEFCIGTDPYHTPEVLLRAATGSLEGMGYSVGINRPFAGSLVPMAFYQKDRRVASIMIEVNRNLYMDEATGIKTDRFETIKGQMQKLLGAIEEVWR